MLLSSCQMCRLQHTCSLRVRLRGSGLCVRCAALHWFVDDTFMRSAIRQQGGGELARAAQERHPDDANIARCATEVIRHM